MSSLPITLYSYHRSSSSWRLRIALNLKRISYTIKPIHIVKDGGQQFNPDFQRLNPMGHVPVLSIDGNNFTESVAIMEYLEETRPDHPLLPKDPAGKAQVRAIVEMINSGIQPMQNLSILNYVSTNFGQPARTPWGAHWVHRGLTAVEKVLEKTSGKFCFGDQLSFADCALVPQFNSAARFGVDTTPFPVATRIMQLLETLPEVQAAHPSAQPDAMP